MMATSPGRSRTASPSSGRSQASPRVSATRQSGASSSIRMDHGRIELRAEQEGAPGSRSIQKAGDGVHTLIVDDCAWNRACELWKVSPQSAFTALHDHPRPDAREPSDGRALHLHSHGGQHWRRAARIRLRPAPRRRGAHPARPPDPDRALRGGRRPHAIPGRAAQADSPPGGRRGGRTRRGAFLRERGPGRGPSSGRGSPGAGDGGHVRRGRRDGAGRANDASRPPPQSAGARRARAQVRPGGSRAAARLPPAARAARPAGVPGAQASAWTTHMESRVPAMDSLR